MNKVLYIILISLFSLTVFSCGEKEESTTSTSTSTLDPPTCPSDNTDCITAGYYQNELDWNDVSGATGYTVYWSTSTGVSSSSTAITGITDSITPTQASTMVRLIITKLPLSIPRAPVCFQMRAVALPVVHPLSPRLVQAKKQLQEQFKVLQELVRVEPFTIVGTVLLPVMDV